MPVGYDRDGAVSDLYRVGGCPTVAFAYPGGILGVREGEHRGALEPPTEAGSLRPGSSATSRRCSDSRGNARAESR